MEVWLVCLYLQHLAQNLAPAAHRGFSLSRCGMGAGGLAGDLKPGERAVRGAAGCPCLSLTAVSRRTNSPVRVLRCRMAAGGSGPCA